MARPVHLGTLLVSTATCLVTGYVLCKTDWPRLTRQLRRAFSRLLFQHCPVIEITTDDVEGGPTGKLPKTFNEATSWVASHGKACPVEDQLQLYGFYKQATVGNCADPEPSIVELARHAKWNAWRQCTGMEPEEAEEAYVGFVRDIIASRASTGTGQQKIPPSGSPMGKPQSSLRSIEQQDDRQLSKVDRFFRHAANGDLAAIVEDLRSDAALVTARNDDDMTALHLAADRGHVDVIDFLLEKGADVNAQDNSGETPLHVAVVAENLDVISLLLKRNADISLQSHDGETVLDVANQTDNPELVQVVTASKAT
ncbi:ankyrin repeat-containing protein [Toxoplasma gondii RUB]|uniref:Ankyrin repeat-containing protein n=3 Tax=Toxoplasma gondii TaxID=5811 RepID=S7WBI1_TOXGG|nr:ankyrin repeat-containing protein [Toxoplasma gondii GT1]KAF4640317.1 ankyrin repeat-containing protein [Toxoplasma gondii]KFG58061.1 ankyrin repeat-containing protein [Toxoplasma gondii RUB]